MNEATLRSMNPYQRATTLTCGVDAVDLDTFGRALQVGGERFLEKVYTAQELAYCSGRLQWLAAYFAAKEAVSKALGTGMRGVKWREIEVTTNNLGHISVQLWGCAAKYAAQHSLTSWTISFSYCKIIAVAFAIGIAGTEEP